MRENIGLYRGKPKNKGDYHFFSLNWKEHCKDGFVYGSLVIAHGRYYICVSALCRVNCCVNNSTASMIEVIPETVGEFTGLTDKNGKKIFEGDIVKHHFGEEYGVVKFGEYSQPFNDDKFTKHIGFYVDWFIGKSKDILRKDLGYWANIKEYDIFIGNIHDNPELLKGEVDNGK